MTIIRIIDTFAFYGLDVILLAAVTCAVVQLIKLTLLKKCKKKIVTFLPFVIGCIFYAAYAAVKNLSFKVLLDDYVSILEHGVSVGALSTVIYVWYEQFIREKKSVNFTTNVISTLIDGYVPSDKVEQIAEQIALAVEKDVTGDGAKKTAEILSGNAAEGISENDIKLLAKLIIETLAHVVTT